MPGEIELNPARTAINDLLAQLESVPANDEVDNAIERLKEMLEKLKDACPSMTVTYD